MEIWRRLKRERSSQRIMISLRTTKQVKRVIN